jgi:hypothetical protein
VATRGCELDRELTPQVLNEWLGERLLIKYMTGPDIDLEDVDRTVTGQPQARTELLYLDQVGTHGIAVKKVAEGKPEFLPWGAVLAIQDIKRDESDDVV